MTLRCRMNVIGKQVPAPAENFKHVQEWYSKPVRDLSEFTLGHEDTVRILIQVFGPELLPVRKYHDCELSARVVHSVPQPLQKILYLDPRVILPGPVKVHLRLETVSGAE